MDQQPQLSSEHIATVRGNLQLAYKTWGVKGGKPWVLLHGWLDNAASFDLLAPLILKLSKEPLWLVCVDLAGHGQSGQRYNNVYHLVDYAADIVFLIEELGIDKFHLLGHSLGAGISVMVAAALPTKVQKLILLEGLGSSETPGGVVSTFVSSLKHFSNRGEYDTPEDASQRRSKANVVGGELDIKAARTLASRGTKQIENGKVVWSYDAGTKHPSRVRLHGDTNDEFTQAVQCPTLLVVTDDGLFAKATILGQPFYKLLGFLLLGIAYLLGWFGSFLPIIGARINKQLPMMWIGYSIARRVRLINNLKIQSYPDGGHHPHMLESHSSRIAKNIIDFVSA